MTIFEVESWYVAEGKSEEHSNSMRNWLKWVHDHRDLFPEWKSVRYFTKYIAGEESDRHLIIWEYDSLQALEQYKNRRGNYEEPYKEYKKVDPYYMDVFVHPGMTDELWKPLERDLWIE
jgi:hypothetical protein